MATFRLRHYIMITPVPSIIEHHRDGMTPELDRKFFQELDDARAINVPLVRHGKDLMGDGMEGP